ncbi:MAG: OmpA family protein [Campylobacteraceae bacterium]|jgi:OOP family OmpA-OmpF porin|nr:OmpA family protein [Campylobacteraceae bacterium]
MKKVGFIAIALGVALMATESGYEVTPTIGGVFPEGNLDLKNQLSAGLRVGKYLDNDFISKVEGGVEFTSTHYNIPDGVNGSKQQALITRFFVHGIKEFEVTDNTYLYALLGVGHENIRKKARYGNNDSPYGNYGVGIRHTITDNLFLRAELRHAIKLHSGHGDNNLFATLGISYAFGEQPEESAVSTVKSSEPVKIETTVEEKPQKTVEAAEVKVVEEADSDNDGVVDNKDLCPNTPSEFSVDDKGCIRPIILKINFASNKADILDEFKPEIESIAKILKNETDYKVILEGHTDSTGSKELNEELSERRAKSVAQELLNLGIDESRITTEWFGPEKPVATNSNAEGRAKNRRIEAIFTK